MLKIWKRKAVTIVTDLDKHIFISRFTQAHSSVVGEYDAQVQIDISSSVNTNKGRKKRPPLK